LLGLGCQRKGGGMEQIKLLLVDDHELVRTGLRATIDLEEDIEVVGEAGDAQAAVEQAIAHRPTVVLMDVRLGQVDGIEACRRIREELPDVAVVMLSSFGDEETVVSSVVAGAVDYLLKNVRRADLLKAIRAAANGESLLDPSVTRGVLDRLRALEQRDDPLVASLSTREREVVCLVAKGHTNREIGDQLFIAETTARNHVSRIFARLGMSRRSEASAFVAQHGLNRTSDAGA
jgi:DNA-binding NarL/FixJ family response regulator